MLALDGVIGTLRDPNQFNERSLSTEPSSLILTCGQRIGLIVSVLSSSTIRPTLSHVQLTSESSCLSFGAILVIFVLIVVRSISFQRHPV